MADFNLVDPRGWEYDLQSVYSAYIGHFQLHGVAWYERSWGHFFASFEDFLAFSWPVITVTDSWTGKAHIVTRMTSIGAFIKMIKTRFGETLPVVDNMLKITPFESTQRHLRTISDWQSYKKIHSTLPAAVLAALKVRIKAGEPKAIQNLWEKREKTFLAIDFEWSERNPSSALEWGYAAVRCGHLEAQGHWPPVPDKNYRKGHFIVEEYIDKVINKHCPTHPWQYEFAESQIISKTKLPQVIQAIISSLASPESETVSNNLVLVGHGISGDLTRLEEMKIKLPHNILLVDTAAFERSLFSTGHRHLMTDPKTNKPRTTGSTLSLEHLLRSLLIDIPCQLHNAGNDALMCLFALQKLLDPDNTTTPTRKVRPGLSGAGPGAKPLNRMGGPGLVAPVPVPASAPVATAIPPIIVPPVPPNTAGLGGFTPGQVNSDADYYANVENEPRKQVRRLPGRQKGSPTANTGGFQHHSKWTGTYSLKGKKNSGRNGDALSGPMGSMALR